MIADRKAMAISNAAVVAEHVSENDGTDKGIAGQISSPYFEIRTFIRQDDQGLVFSIRSPTCQSNGKFQTFNNETSITLMIYISLDKS